MEEGSLLQEALEYMERMRNGTQLEDDTHDALQLDVYDVRPQPDRISRLQRLAQLASEFNNYIQQSDFPWHTGFPPVFGIHVTESIPHLRAVCRYGDNVGDEWAAIRCTMELSQMHPTVAIDCWDLDVGPILLIEGSDGLPDWLSEGQVDDSRYICWVINGKITLIGPTIKELTLQAALDCLRNDRMLSTPPKLQTELSKTTMNDSLWMRQRTAQVVPRPIARLLRRAPELANAAAVAYAKSPSPVMTEKHQDWVWATCPLARTNYAMLRTISPKESQKLTAELKRIQRTCANEATPHLQHASEMGMHLTAGLDSLLEQKSDNVHDPMSPMERRVLQYWTGTDVECGGDGSWLQEAWQMGPNNSPYDMMHVMKCPVFKYEHMHPFPVAHPGETLQEVLRAELSSRKPEAEEKFVIPRPEDVDDEGWIHCGDEVLKEAMAKRGPGAGPDQSGTSTFDASTEAPDEQQLDNILGGFQQFMAGESEVEGIAHNESTKRDRPGPDEPLHINPRIFLNLLRDVLKSSPEDLARNLNGVKGDPFFSEEDYALMEPVVPLEGENDSRSSEEMETIMVCMRLW